MKAANFMDYAGEGDEIAESKLFGFAERHPEFAGGVIGVVSGQVIEACLGQQGFFFEINPGFGASEVFEEFRGGMPFGAEDLGAHSFRAGEGKGGAGKPGSD